MMHRHAALVDTSPLSNHGWDTPAARAAIHAAFDRWFICHMGGNQKQAARYLAVLKTLTDAARAPALNAQRIR